MAEQVPQVGASVQALCTRCRKTTRHIVVSVVGRLPGRVRCAICEGDHNYRSPRSTATARPKGPPKGPRGTSAVVQEWEGRVGTRDPGEALPYEAGRTYRTGDLLAHPTFGLGLVRKVIPPNKVEVHFRSGIKRLVCAS